MCNVNSAIKTTVGSFLLLSFFAFAICYPANAQRLSPTEHRALLNSLLLRC